MIGAVRPARARTNACQPSPRTRSTLHGKYIWFKPQCAEPVYLRRRAASEDWTRNLGSPPPPGPPVPEGSPAPLPGSAETLAPPVPTETAPPPGGQNEGPAVAPSAFNTNGVAPTLSVSIAQYDPRTGRYAAPDGQVYQQTDLVTGTPNSWQDVILRADAYVSTLNAVCGSPSQRNSGRRGGGEYRHRRLGSRNRMRRTSERHLYGHLGRPTGVDEGLVSRRSDGHGHVDGHLHV